MVAMMVNFMGQLDCVMDAQMKLYLVGVSGGVEQIEYGYSYRCRCRQTEVDRNIHIVSCKYIHGYEPVIGSHKHRHGEIL